MWRGRGGSEQGSVAITVTLALTVLLGFAALVVDVGLNWAARTSAQTAADAAALAGASRLLLDGTVPALASVEELLDENISGLVPSDPGWATDGVEANGEVVCWTLPDPPPPIGVGCPAGSDALQVITPPVQVNYAFAPVLGKTSNSIKAMAAAAVGPAAPNNCVLCLLDPIGDNRLAALGPGGVDVTGGGIVVNSTSPAALVSVLGDVSASQIRVLGGFDDGAGGGDILPLPQTGGPPVPDPLEDLPTPDLLPSPPTLQSASPVIVTGDETRPPGIYSSIRVEGTATLTLQPGVYVFTGDDGLTVVDDARVVSGGGGVTIYLACAGYPDPCSGPGARFRLEGSGQFQADPPAGGDYAGLSIFADRGNTTPLSLLSSLDLQLPGALYGASTPVRVESSGDLEVGSLLLAGSLTQPLTSTGSVIVSYDPSDLLPGIGLPVLIR
jgi:hypothetical protein